MKTKCKRLLSLLLVFVLVLGLIPSVYAATDAGTQTETSPAVTEAATIATDPTEAVETQPMDTQDPADETEPEQQGDPNAGIMSISEEEGIMPLALSNKLSNVTLLDLASPYNYTIMLPSQISVQYKPNGTGSSKVAYLKNIAWHYYSYGGTGYRDETLYCIEPYKNFASSTPGNYADQGVDVYGSNTSGSTGSSVWYDMPTSYRRAIAYILQCSENRWDHSVSAASVSKENNPNFPLRTATQILIYEIVMGLRNADTFELKSSNGYEDGDILYNAFVNQVSGFSESYFALVADVQGASLIPSFTSSSSSTAPTIELEDYLTWVHDDNEVMSEFTFTDDDYIIFNCYGNDLCIENYGDLTGTRSYSCYRAAPSDTDSTFSIFYPASSSYQTCVNLFSPATSYTYAYFKLYAPVSTGDFEILKKTSDGQNLGGWKFSVYLDANCTNLLAGPYTTSSAGRLAFTGTTPGTYYVREEGHTDPAIEAKYTCTSTNPQKITVVAGGTASVTFNNTLKPGTLSLVKTTSDGKNLAGWQFEIYSNAACTSKISGPHTTDSNGRLSVSLSAGTVYVKEIGHQTASINSQYNCTSTNPQKVTLTAGQTSSVSFTNTLKPSGLNITKTTEDGLNLSGWQFSIYSDSACTTLVSGPHTSNSSGAISVSSLSAGTYYVKEIGHSDAAINAKYQCESTNPQKVTLTSGSTASVTFSNILVPGYVKIVKTTNTGLNLGGWKFNIYTDVGRTNLVSGSPFTSASDGTITATLKPGTYYIKEVNESSIKPDWTFDDSVKTVTLTAGNTATVTFENTHYGYARIVKQTNTGKNLSGWKFNIYTDSGCTQLLSGSPFTSGSDGTITAKVLPGTYYIKEYVANPSADWDYDSSVRKVTVTGGATASVTFTNCHFGYAKIIKVTSTGENLEGWKFNIYADETCTTLVEGSPFVSGEDGTITTRIPAGTYYVQEVDESSTNPEWVYDTTLKEIVVEGGKTASVTFSNTQRGYAQIKKQTNTGENLGGWKFHIYTDKACTQMVTGSPFMTAEDGTVKAMLLPGTYYVREVDESKDKPDWVFDDTVYEVTVEAGKTATITATNEQMGRVKLIKTMPDGGSVAGWTFDIHTADGKTHLGTYVSDEDGIILTDYILPGEILITEQIPEDSPYVCEGENPKKVTIESGKTAEVTFTNRLKTAEIVIQKTDITGAPLAGAEFLLEWSKDGKTWTPVVRAVSEGVVEGTCGSAGIADGKLTSDESGLVTFTRLHPDSYYRLTETKAPDGYQLLKEAVFEGKIPEEKDLKLEFTVVNVRTFQLPETGSKSLTLTILSLTLAAGLCAVLLFEAKRRDHRK